MLRKFWFCVLSLLLVAACLAGCGGESSAADREYGGDGLLNEAPSKGESDAELEGIADSGRKLIRTVSVSAQTKNYDTFLATLRDRVGQAGGYIQSSSENEATSRKYRYATLVLRIPAAETDGILDLFGSLGTVTRKEEQMEDVTLDYVDTQSRLKAFRAEEESLLRMLEDAQSVGDIISIRDRLTQVQYQIEAYESALRTFDNQIDYCTVTLSLTEVEREQAEDPSVWSEIGGNLSDAMKNLGLFFRYFFVYFVSALPYLLVFVGIPGGIALAIVLPLRKKKKNRDAAKKE